MREDVRAGFLTPARAEEAYGVVLVEGVVDAAATARRRSAMPAPSSGGFDLGERRAEMERRWPPVVQDAALRVLESVPAAVRDWGKHQIYERIQEIAAERPPRPADVEAVWAEIRARLSRALGEE